jgi:hypothetical protein
LNTTKVNPTGIPTVYAGIEFRSRLEARWAAFFDRIQLRWTYEAGLTGRWDGDLLILGADPLPAWETDDNRLSPLGLWAAR